MLEYFFGLVKKSRLESAEWALEQLGKSHESLSDQIEQERNKRRASDKEAAMMLQRLSIAHRSLDALQQEYTVFAPRSSQKATACAS